MNELNSTAGDVLREMEAPEAMLLLDWNASVEANFPPSSILIAGALSPLCMKLMTYHHLLQMVTVGLPVLALCVAAIIVDWSAPCPSIPTIFAWGYTQTTLAACLVIAHGVLLIKITAGKSKLAAKAQEIVEKNKGISMSGIRDQFIGQTILLQEALLIENDIKGCIWNKIVGAASAAWLITTLWNLFLIARYTFVPGVVAFHPDAAKVAPEAYCGTWMTVLVLRVNLLLAVLYFFINLGSVIQWVCDLMVENQGFQNSVLTQARRMDGGGLPVVELLVKSLVLRGGSDTLDARLAVIQNHKYVLEKEVAEVEGKQSALQKELERVTAEEQALKAKAEDGGDIAAQTKALSEGAVSFDDWKARGDTAIAEAEAKAQDVQEATTKALEDLYEKISSVADAAKAKANEAEAKAKEAMDKVNDPEFQKQLQENANKAMKEARAAAEQAKAAATDPEMQKKLAEAAQKATDHANAAASKATEHANAAASKATEHANAAATKVQSAADQAKAAAQDPELQKKLAEAAEQANSAGEKAAKEVAAAAKKAAGKK